MKVLFSDLDGTILDHHTYSYSESTEGINLLKDRNVPLVLVSSKTFPEIIEIHKELELCYPFVFENGGGIAYPEAPGNDEYKVTQSGESIDVLKDKFEIFRGIVSVKVKKLIDMGIKEIVEETGLSEENAGLAKKRTATIPFIPVQQEKRINIENMNSLLYQHGVYITKGGRFYHFSSIGADKGSAVKKIVHELGDSYKVDKVTSVGIGDSENDLPMLEAVDIPFLVRRFDNTTIKTDIKNITITNGIGPGGFTEAVKSIFNVYD